MSRQPVKRSVLATVMLLGVTLLTGCGDSSPAPDQQPGSSPEELAGLHPDIVFGKVDTEAEGALAAAARISSIPTLMAFKDGALVFSQPGALPAAALEDVIAQVRALDVAQARAEAEAAAERRSA